MRKLILSFILLLASFQIASAQEWTTDINKAKQVAAKEHKPIILVFQGSDWCAPCIKLDKEIWQADSFKTYAKTHYVMLQADFPRKKKNALPADLQAANNKLAEKYNPNGYFPFVVVLDEKGNVLGKTGYEKTTPEAYIKNLNAFL